MYSFDSRVRYSEIGADGKMTLASVLNYFQDCSTFHSEELGVGLDYLRESSLGWVLSYWQIDIVRYPALCEKITIGTFPYAFRGFLGSRNFVMLDEKGENVAFANSIWSLLDLNTGHPGRVPDRIVHAYTIEEKLPMEYESRKIILAGTGVPCEPFPVRPHHIDSNHHVNNGQYVQMAMEYLPEEFEISRMRAEYKKAALLQDMITPIIEREEKKITVSLCDETKSPYAVVEFKTCLN